MMKSAATENRKRLQAALPGRVIVLSAHQQLQRSNDTAYAFEQEANFWWLTGITDPDWWLIIDGARGKSWLVSPDVSATHQIFDGSLSGEDALERSGVDAVISNDRADTLLRELAQKHSLVHALGDDPYAKYYDFFQNPAPKAMWKRLERIFTTVEDCRSDLAKLRAIKQPEEIKAMKKAIDLTLEAFTAVKQKLP